jgi:lipopolysaccharide exporter
MVLFRLLDRSVGIVSTAVLARLLLPADFGLVAMAMSIIAVIELATTFSFEIGLIQKPSPRPEHYDTAWTLNIIAAAAGAAITAALAFPTASFYGDERLVPVMFAIGAAWFVSGFENVGTVDFRRRMDFASEFRLMATRRLIAFVVTMIAVVTLRSYWALIIGSATARLAGVVLSYRMQPLRPRLSLACSGELFSFSGWMVANNLIGVVIGRVPHFIVGRLFGAQSLGAYTVGAEIAHLAYSELVAPINRAMFPGYARLADDRPAFRQICVDATAAILLVVLPASVLIAVLAGPIVRVLLGDQWSQAVPVIQVLVISGAISAVTSNNLAAYLALGRQYLTMVILLARLVLLALAIALLADRQGLIGVAYAELFASLGSLAVTLPILFATLQLSAREYLRGLWRPLVASALTGIAVLGVLRLLAAPDTLGGALAQLAVGVPAGVLIYPTLVALLWRMSGRAQTIEVLIARRALGWLQARMHRAAGPT